MRDQQPQEEVTVITGQEKEQTDLDPCLAMTSETETVTYRIAVCKIFKGITNRKTKIDY